MRILFWVIILGFGYGCQHKDIKKEYYENGALKFEVQFQNGKINGSHKEFYESGVLKTLSYADNDIFSDTIIGYYDNGNLEFLQFKIQEGIDSIYMYDKFKKHITSKGKIVNNQLNGWLDNFDEKGKVISTQEFISLDADESYINQEIHFEGEKIIDSLSAYYIIKVKDTLKRNEESSILFKYSPIISKDSQVLICYSSDINDDYSNIANVKLDTLALDNFQLNTKIKFTTHGNKNIKGFFVERYVDYQKVENDTLVEISTKTHKMYFNVEIFVKDMN